MIKRFKNILVADNFGSWYYPILDQAGDKMWFVRADNDNIQTPRWGASLLNWNQDKLFIDFGQDWYFTGLHAALAEARAILKGEKK